VTGVMCDCCNRLKADCAIALRDQVASLTAERDRLANTLDHEAEERAAAEAALERAKAETMQAYERMDRSHTAFLAAAAERDEAWAELKRTTKSITADVKKLDEMRPRVKALGDQRDAAEATLRALREAWGRWARAGFCPREAIHYTDYPDGCECPLSNLARLLAAAPEQPGGGTP
jgi:chromosome segregation ATPase